LIGVVTVFFVCQAARPFLCAFERELYLKIKEPGSIPPSREDVAMLKKHVPDDQIVLSNAFPQLRIFGKMNVRSIPRTYHPVPGVPPLTWRDIEKAGKDGRLWGIALCDVAIVADGYYGNTLREIVVHPERFPPLRKLDAPANLLVLRFVR